MEVVKFSQEYTFGSKTYKELELDFDNLTGFDLLKLENEFKKRMPGFNIKEYEDAWYTTVAAKVGDVKYGDLLKLKAKDFVKLTLVVKGFFDGYRYRREERNGYDNRRVEVLELLDLVLGVLEALNMSNDYTSSLNISYNTLMSCSLYELQYWCEMAKDKIERAEKLAEKNKG